MATTKQDTTETEYQNIVIIGASFAGHALANRLGPQLPPTHRILLVERNTFCAHIPAVVRAVVVPGRESKNFTAPITQETIFPAGSRHRLLCPNAVVELKRTSVVLKDEFEGSTEVFFDRCVLATGADQALPLRPAPSSTLDDYLYSLREQQVAFAKAESVLIVGAGAAGLEVAGELTSLYAGKRVTIVHPYDRVLKTSDQLGNKDFSYVPVSDWLCDSLEMQLRARGVEFVLGDRVVFPESEDVPQGDWTGHKGLLPGLQTVHLKSGKTVSTDLVFVSTGNKPNAGLVKVADERSLAGPYIAVDGFFRVHAEDSAGVMGGQYCAIGDCANVPGRKRSGIAIGEGYKLAKMLAATLKAEARGQTAVLKPHNRWRGTSITVPLHDGHGAPGDGIGAGEIDLWILGKWSVPTFFIRMLAKDYVANQFFSLFRGVQPVSRG